MTLTSTPASRRTMLAGAFGLGALGSTALAAGPAEAALGDPAIPSTAWLDMYLKLPGIPGASFDDRHRDEIPVLTWAWGVDTTTTVFGGGGAGIGRPRPRPFLFAANTDIQSPKLALIASTGGRLATAVLTCVKAGDRPFTFTSLAFTDLAVTSCGVTLDPDEGRPYDLVSMSYRKVTQSVWTQRDDGSVGDPVVMTFDYATNRGS
jgi:type VI secretion system secreted protein Hcp